MKIQFTNIWDLADLFLKEYPNVKFCMSQNTFFFYKNNLWNTINKNELTRLFLFFLQTKFPETYKDFDLKNLDNVFLLLQQKEEFSMPIAIANANSKGFLIPFKNGVLNVNTFELIPHSPENFSTHMIPLNYSKEDTIFNTPFANWLTDIVNKDLFRLQILRACLYSIFTNNLKYQIALYIYGPGGTGKSTFINILIYLLGREITLSTSFDKLTSKIGLSSIVNKKLLVLNDISLNRDQELSTIKNIIKQDNLESVDVYQQSHHFIANCFVVFTSKNLLDIRNANSDLSRRFIYLPFENIPLNKDLLLFKTLSNGEVIGTLVPFLSGFINWILTCPKENIEILYLGGSKITQKINQDSLVFNPIKFFVKDCLVENPGHSMKIGSRPDQPKTLFHYYITWCKNNGVIHLSNKSFSLYIIEYLKLQNWNIIKKRMAAGYVIKGIAPRSEFSTKLNNEINEIIKSENQDKELHNILDSEFHNN